MSILNRLFGGVLDAALWPFRGLPALVGLAFVALLVAVFVLLVYRATSNQEGITAVRKSIVASLLEMRLFKDDLLVVFRAQGRVLMDSLRYFGYSLVPLAWILVPLILLFIQLDRVYGYRPLAPGEDAIVSVEFAPSAGERATTAMDLTLEASPGIVVETPPLRIESSNEVNWRIRGEVPGEHSLTVRAGGETSPKVAVVASGRAAIAPTRPSSGFFDQILHPGEPPLPSDSPIRQISVHYNRATVSFLGWQVHWVIPFLILTIVFGFSLQRPLGVKL